MAWKFDNERPIYIQLVENLKQKILSGEYKPGCKIPSVRDLALESGVNPNTMQKALSELESQGLIKTEKTVGRNVTEDLSLLRLEKDKIAKEKTKNYVQSMRELGVYKKDVLAYLKEEIDK